MPPGLLVDGRSCCYEARRAARGSTAQRAPRWSDAALDATVEAMEAREVLVDGRGAASLLVLLKDEAELGELLDEVGSALPVADARTAAAVLGFYEGKVLAAVAAKKLKKALQAATTCYEVLRTRKRRKGTVRPLVLDELQQPKGTFHKWLAEEPETERLRPIARSARIVNGLRRWPLRWLARPAVVCYERMAARVDDERDGYASAAFLRGVVATEDLPTAVSAAADQYVLVSPDGSARFLTVEEQARSAGISEDSPLMAMLSSSALTCNQAAAEAVQRGRQASPGAGRRPVAVGRR